MAKDIQPVSLVGGTIEKAAVQSVTAAGTRQQLPGLESREVIIYALGDNTGSIYVGGDDVSSAVFGIELAAKDSLSLPVSNANEIYIDASVSGEGISYFVIAERR